VEYQILPYVLHDSPISHFWFDRADNIWRKIKKHRVIGYIKSEHARTNFPEIWEPTQNFRRQNGE